MDKEWTKNGQRMDKEWTKNGQIRGGDEQNQVPSPLQYHNPLIYSP